MRAIVARPGFNTAFLVDCPEPSSPASGEVLCRTLQLGVCGTDREILASGSPLVPPGQDHLILGHECLARIEAVGPDVTALRAGDLVVPMVRRACSSSPVRVDLLAFGDYSERGIVREHGFSGALWLDRPQYLLAVDRDLADVAVLAEPLSIAEKGVNEALTIQRARLGESAWADPPPRVLVTGMGPIGFAAVIACSCRGWPVSLRGRDPTDTYRVEQVRALGARYLPGTVDDPIPPPDGRLDGPGTHDAGYDLVLECTGSDEVLAATAGALAPRGVMVWLGSSRTPRPRRHNLAGLIRHSLLRNNIHVGCVNSAPRDFADALEHLAVLHRTQSSLLEALITERVAPDEALWHYENRRPQGIKTVLMYAPEES